MLISASYDNSIKVWTEEDDDWYATETLNGHTSTVWSISFNRDGSKMISCSDDKSMILWERSSQSPQPSTDSSTTQSNNVTGSWRLRQKLTGQHERCIYTVDWAKNESVMQAQAQAHGHEWLSTHACIRDNRKTMVELSANPSHLSIFLVDFAVLSRPF